MTRDVAIVPHTHWDREWYVPFQAYRIRLVSLLDEFIPLLERDPSYSRFLLDGQTAAIDDYLEVRPGAEASIRKLASEGRLAAGPWMILMDEFMVSGETILRNLQLGMARAMELGNVMNVGYLPDMFGHIAQMPQILRLAGIEHAVVWRGVPAAVDKTAFWWESPNGSQVRAEYLYGSYSNGRDLPEEAPALVARARDYEHELGDAHLNGAALLLMNGTDHQTPQPWLGRVVEEANAAQSDYRFVVTSLHEHLPTQPVVGLPLLQGELRSGASSNMLMGVTSNRMDVKNEAAAAERAIERRAEPISVLFRDAIDFPTNLLDIAWRNLVLNSAHDSSCACSHDEVVDQVLVRYREARQIGDGITKDTLDRLAFQVDAAPGSTVVVNLAPTPRCEVVDVIVPGTGPLHFLTPAGSTIRPQVTEHPASEAFSAIVTGSKTGWVLDMMRGHEFAGRRARSYSLEERSPGGADALIEILIEAAAPGEPSMDLGELRERVLTLATDRDRVFSFRLLRAPTRSATFLTDAVPAFGWSTYTPVDADAPIDDAVPSVLADGTTLRNEHLSAEVDPANGTFRIENADGLTVSGLNRYIDGGDGGDTYNYSPPSEDSIVDLPTSVAVSILETGPVRARLQVLSRYQWPTHAEGDERSCAIRVERTASVEIRTTLELRCNEKFLRVHVEIDNPCRDHRLRAHFPLPRRVAGSHAGCAFAVVHRGLTAEGGVHEHGLPTFPAHSFVDCSGPGSSPHGEAGLAILHDGLVEYEILGDGTELAVTLLRATGYLSRLEPSLRPNPAGPPVAVRGAQMLGPQSLDFAVMLHQGTWGEAAMPRMAIHAHTPFEVATTQDVTTAERPPGGSFLSVDGADVSALTRDAQGRLILRLVNLAPSSTIARVRRPGGSTQGDIVNLLGEPCGRFDGEMSMSPWEIATLRLDGG